MRLFLGISLPEAIRREVSARALSAQSRIPGRYGIAQNYHVTLAFVGEIAPEREKDVHAVLAQCVSRRAAPRLTLGPLDFFGRPQNAILILRVLSDPPLDALHTALTGALSSADLPFDPGPFSPHITLARHACVPPHLSMEAPAGPSRFVPDAAHVFLSARDERGVLTYTPIFSAPFSGESAIF